MVAITRMQKRNALTIPLSVRIDMALHDGQPVVLRQLAVDQWLCTVIPEGPAFFAEADAQFEPPDPLPPVGAMRWLTVPFLVRAHALAEGPERALLDRCSRGRSQLAADPVVLPDVLGWLSQGFPAWDRPRQAAYVQTLLAWPGLAWPDRTRWLTVLSEWADQPAITWAEAALAVRDRES